MVSIIYSMIVLMVYVVFCNFRRKREICRVSGKAEGEIMKVIWSERCLSSLDERTVNLTIEFKQSRNPLVSNHPSNTAIEIQTKYFEHCFFPPIYVTYFYKRSWCVKNLLWKFQNSCIKRHEVTLIPFMSSRFLEILIHQILS